MCERTRELEGLLLAGEEEVVFAHAAACRSCRVALLEEGRVAAGCAEPVEGYRLLLELDRLAAGKAPTAAAAHAEACPACAAEVASAREALVELAAHESAAAAQPRPDIRIVLSCTFCRDRLTRSDAAYCASCLAPHHPACFAIHGRCAVLGCDDTRTVQPLEVRPPEPPARRSGGPSGRLLGGALGLALVVGGAAALVGTDEAPRPAPASPVPAAVEPTDADPAVARVDGAPIRRSALLQACALDPRYRRLPPGEHSHRLRVRLDVLDVLIEEEVLVQRAEAEGITLSAEDEAGLADHRAALDGLGAGALFGRPSAPPELVAARRRRRLLGERLIDAHVPREVEVPPADVRRYYEAHRQAFRGGETRLRELLIVPDAARAPRTPEVVAGELAAGTWDPRRFAETLRLRAVAGEASFEELARVASMDAEPGAVQVFGTTDMDEVLLPALAAAVEALAVGEVSGVVEAYTGSLHVFQLVARDPGGERPFAEVREEIAALLRREAYERRRRAFLEETRAAAEVHIDAAALGGNEVEEVQ